MFWGASRRPALGDQNLKWGHAVHRMFHVMKMKEIVTRMLIVMATSFAEKIIVGPNSHGNGQTVVWKVSFLSSYSYTIENDIG